ncbi:MAG: ECF transporter S component [Clostridia bacterium]|nr:ECF transporter S component [Clostridia bacterium]
MKQTNTKSIAATALFAAIIFMGIQAFRIPLPAAVGTPFVHFGHIFVMLAIVCLGPVRAAIAGVIGYVIFDVTNGYIHAIPNVFCCTIIKCLLVGYIFLALSKKADGDRKKEYIYAIICSVIYGIANTLLDFVWNTIELTIMGSALGAAFMAELTAIPATFINSAFTVVGIALLYKPVKNAYHRIIKK